MNQQSTLPRINWHQAYTLATQWLGFAAFIAATFKTVVWYNLIGWPALLHNGQLVMVALFCCLFAFAFAKTFTHWAALATAANILVAVIV